MGEEEKKDKEELSAEQKILINEFLANKIKTWMTFLGIANFAVIVGAISYVYFILPNKLVAESKKMKASDIHLIAGEIVDKPEYKNIILLAMENGQKFKGKPGTPGKDGSPGPPGERGTPGTDGADGENGGIREFQVESNKYLLNRVYRADVDGLVTVLGYCFKEGWYVVSGYTDSSSSPTTRVASEMIGGTHWRDYGSFTFPVKKNNYWTVIEGDGSGGGEALCDGNSSVTWMAID